MREELGELANVSGGNFIRASPRLGTQTFDEIVTTLRSVYLIGYYLSDPPVTAVATWRPQAIYAAW